VAVARFAPEKIDVEEEEETVARKKKS